MIHIYINENDTNEYPYDLDERNFDETLRCKWCGRKLFKGNEPHEFGGSNITVPIWYCTECG